MSVRLLSMNIRMDDERNTDWVIAVVKSDKRSNGKDKLNGKIPTNCKKKYRKCQSKKIG